MGLKTKPRPYPKPAPKTLGSRLGTTFFFLIFFAFGLGFLSVMIWQAYQTVQAWGWQGVPCVIEASSVTEGSNDYEFEVAYRYECNGRTWHCDRLAIQKPASDDYAQMQLLTDAYPVGAMALCYVDPADPRRAVLRQGGIWILSFAVIPLLFAVIGAGGLYVTWRRAPMRALISIPRRAKPNKTIPICFFGLFTAIGAALFYILVVRVYLDVQLARNWTTTPCVVLSSRVISHTGNKGGTTYSVDVLYEYAVNGRQRRSNHYDFMGGSSSGYSSKIAIAREFPPGTHAVCYVNPRDPDDAVLDRGYTSDIFYGLLPLVFLAVGVGGIARQLWRR
jgi:hypothetical protein